MVYLALIRKTDRSTKINNPPSSTEPLFTDNNHLELDFLDASELSEVKIWMHRSDGRGGYENSGATVLTEATEMKVATGYDVLVDGVAQGLGLNFFNAEGELTSNNPETVDVEVDATSHNFTLDVTSFGYDKLYKYGSETYSDNNITGGTIDWLEKRISVNAKVTGRIDGSIKTIKFVSAESDYTEFIITSNTDTTEREISITYECEFENDKNVKLFTLHIKQGIFKQIKATFTEIKYDTNEDDKCLLPLTVNYTTYGTAPTYWDKLREVGKKTVPLSIEAAVACEYLTVLPDSQDVSMEESDIGMSNNKFFSKIYDVTLTGTTENFNLSFNSHSVSGTPENISSSVPTIVCNIKPINAVKHEAKVITSMDTFGRVLSTSGKTYWTVEKYSAAFSFIHNSFRYKEDDSYRIEDNEAIVRIKDYLQNDATLRNQLQIDESGTTIAVVPSVYETTVSTLFDDFTINELQSIDVTVSGNTFGMTFEGNEPIYDDPSDLSEKIIEYDPGLTITNTLTEDDMAFFGELGGSDEEEIFYYTGEVGVESPLIIRTDFTNSSKSATTFNISYHPLIYLMGHTAGVVSEFDENEVQEEKYSIGNVETYDVLKYSLKETEILEVWGVASVVNPLPHSATIKKHIAEKSTIKYYMYSLGEESTNKLIPLFNLELNCDLGAMGNDAHNVTNWDGFNMDDCIIQVNVASGETGTAKVSGGEPLVTKTTDTTNYVQIIVKSGDTYTLSVENTNPDYALAYWLDNNTGQKIPLEEVPLTASTDCSYTAYFAEIIKYSIKVLKSPTEADGMVWLNDNTGTTELAVVENETVSINAEDGTNYTFEKWSNNSTSKSLPITVTADTNYTAYFKEIIPVSYSIVSFEISDQTDTTDTVFFKLEVNGSDQSLDTNNKCAVSLESGSTATVRLKTYKNSSCTQVLDDPDAYYLTWDDNFGNTGETTMDISSFIYPDSYTFTVPNSDTGVVRITVSKVEYIDMGRDILWAKCNVGASRPQEYGIFFAWGDPKHDVVMNAGNYKFGTSGHYTKYTRYGDRKLVLEQDDDPAFRHYGGVWRTPTLQEFKDLINDSTTGWTSNYNSTGVKGLIFTLKTDPSKQLFFPAGGYKDGYNAVTVGTYGCYWSTSLFDDDDDHAWEMRIGADEAFLGMGMRYRGLCTRPVRNKT